MSWFNSYPSVVKMQVVHALMKPIGKEEKNLVEKLQCHEKVEPIKTCRMIEKT